MTARGTAQVRLRRRLFPLVSVLVLVHASSFAIKASALPRPRRTTHRRAHGEAHAAAFSALRKGWEDRARAAGGAQQLAFKAGVEVCLAAGLQLTAEVERRRSAFFFEIDYVVAGVLTAVAGKAYAAWRVAPTQAADAHPNAGPGRDRVTNAFQLGNFSVSSRARALVEPVPQLFLAGVCSALAGYGLAAALAELRTALGRGSRPVPPVPLLGAACYTGLVLVTLSNLSYQVLQGIVEARIIERWLSFTPLWFRRFLIAAARAARSLLVSGLAIRGMQYAGLQKRAFINQ